MGIDQVNTVKKRPAVFLDQDGTVIEQVQLLADVKKVRLIPYVAEAVKELNRLGYFVAVVSNQPVIARGLITPEGVEALNAVIDERLKRQGARIDARYFCPHHPNATVEKYRMRCGCRKPGWGMLRQAAREHGISLEKSWVVGDALIDIEMGSRAGAKTILVKTGPGHERLDKLYKAKPDFTAKSILGAARIIKESSK